MGASSVSKGNHKGAGWDNEVVVGCVGRMERQQTNEWEKIARETNLSGRVARLCLFLKKEKSLQLFNEKGKSWKNVFDYILSPLPFPSTLAVFTPLSTLPPSMRSPEVLCNAHSSMSGSG